MMHLPSPYRPSERLHINRQSLVNYAEMFVLCSCGKKNNKLLLPIENIEVVLDKIHVEPQIAHKVPIRYGKIFRI